MFGDLMGDMQARQEEMEKKLSALIVHSEAGDGAVKISANANKHLTDITIDPEKVDLSDREQLEDLLLEAVNRALTLAGDEQAKASQDMIKDILPGGMGGLGNLFGK